MFNQNQTPSGAEVIAAQEMGKHDCNSWLHIHQLIAIMWKIKINI